jgi:hypothetical protein
VLNSNTQAYASKSEKLKDINRHLYKSIERLTDTYGPDDDFTAMFCNLEVFPSTHSFFFLEDFGNDGEVI